MIDQTTLGHLFIKKEFGVTPRVGWQIDPFGHSAVQAYLLGAEVLLLICALGQNPDHIPYSCPTLSCYLATDILIYICCTVNRMLTLLQK